MDRFDRENRIEWGDARFFITAEGTLEVIGGTEECDMCDRETWEEAMLDGPIADLRRFNELTAGYGLWEPIDTIRAIEKMLLVSRKIFIQPLNELENFARYYNGGRNEGQLL
jgi:hypothetical protein